MPSAVRVLVVTTALVPEQLATWRYAAECGAIDLHIAGSLTHDSSESYLAPLGIPTWGTVHVLPARGFLSRGRLWWQLEGLESLIRRLEPDVVHVHSEVWGRLVTQALRGDSPVVAHGAENVSVDHGGRLEALIRRLVTRRNARRLAGYASWNTAGIGVLRANGLPYAAPSVVAPAIVPDPTAYLQVEGSGRGFKPVVVGYLGRLVPEKGLQWLLCALDGVPNVQLLVVGSGPYEGQLRRQAERRGISAKFCGALEPAMIPEFLSTIDVLVVPSVARPGWAEQFGRVVCEAMFAGVPVVVSSSGALAEVVGDAGVVVPELSHEELHAALIKLIMDEGARSDLALQGREWAIAQLGPEAAAKRLVDLWQTVSSA